jgi:thiamine-monophosphate kinase
MKSEKAWIEFIKEEFFPTGSSRIGDDSAVFDITQEFLKGDVKLNHPQFLITEDQLIENIHFKSDHVSPFRVGQKLVERNLSDIAAQGGVPKWALMTLAFSKNTKESWMEEFLMGVKESLSISNVELVGGDIAQLKDHQELHFTMTLMGLVDKKNLKRRVGAQEHDKIVVTGKLGESWCHDYTNLKRAQVDEGIFISQFLAVHSMMDVSDGLSKDLIDLTEKGQWEMRIYLDQLPLYEGLLERKIPLTQFEIWEKALGGGEDYCLLFTVDPDSFQEIKEKFEQKFKRKIYEIGEVLRSDKNDISENCINYFDQKGGALVKLMIKGFEHFSNP